MVHGVEIVLANSNYHKMVFWEVEQENVFRALNLVVGNDAEHEEA